MNHAEGKKRSQKQEQFIAALLSYPAIEAAAKAVGIGHVSAHTACAVPLYSPNINSPSKELLYFS
jgi:hypothetical protein